MKLSPTLPLPTSSRGPWPTWVFQVVFLLTGVWSTLTIQSIANRGGTHCPAFVPICNYTGYMLVPFLVRTPSGDGSFFSEKANILFHIKRLFASATLDVLATNLSVGGIALAGSGLFQVSYSSIVVMTAIFARIFLHKLMNKAQWVAIMSVFAGLLTTAGDLSNVSDDSSGFVVVVGVIASLGSALSGALNYVVSERVLRGDSNRIRPERLPAIVGSIGWVFMMIMVLVTVVPSWDMIVVKPIVDAGSSGLVVLSMYAMVIASAALHNWAFFAMLGSVGSVSAGILQGFRAVLVFIASHMMYCGTDSGQCLTTFKSIGACLVVTGTFFYAKHTPKN